MTWRVTIELQLEADDLLEISQFLKSVKAPSDLADKITGVRADALTADEAIPLANIPNN